MTFNRLEVVKTDQDTQHLRQYNRLLFGKGGYQDRGNKRFFFKNFPVDA
jgi:hypothetical protein